MIYPIVIYGQAVLKTVAKEISQDYPNLQEVIDNMFLTQERARGIGLAAPQIGKSIRLFVIDLSPMADEDPSYADFHKVFINPEILSFSEELSTAEEGCLSVPGIQENVKRSESVTIKYRDEHWEEHLDTFTGFLARVVQHEYDHLEGHVFVDRVSLLRKQMISSKLAKMAKGKVRTSYKVRK